MPSDQGPGGAEGPRYWADTEKEFTTLGFLKKVNHPCAEFYEHWHLKFIYKCLTDDWGLIQGGSDPRARTKWQEVMQHLELDRKAMVDLFLLAHSGEAGRAEANEILWSLLSIWALKPEYEDLSHKTSSLVKRARRFIDRPPRTHDDRLSWCWKKTWEPRHPEFMPSAVPRDYSVVKGPGGVPLAPPQCWGRPGQRLQ